MPDLSTLTSLNPLHGRCSVINAAALFHIFNEEEQLHLARALAGLLSPVPGSIICGINTGARDKGPIPLHITDRKYHLFSHSAETWMDLWYGNAFEKEEAEVWVKCGESVYLGETMSYLLWYVKRL
ncbi:hypothetical protein ID866_12201 [Astraeus odoratus]|nr:hypothetical protein ID866_12201 [Astraeus odoratus]